MRWLGLVLGLALSATCAAQEVPKKKKKAAKHTEMKAHQKPSRDQIRRFNELQKKQQP